MSDFMKDREHENKRVIEGYERQLREMDRMIENTQGYESDPSGFMERVGYYLGLVGFPLLYFVLPVILVGIIFIGIGKFLRWIF